MSNIWDRNLDFLTEEETWQMISQFEKEENKGSRIVLLGGFFLMIGMASGVASGRIVYGLPLLAIGFVIFILGVRRSTSANDRKNEVIYRQIGPFAHREYEKEIGPFSLLSDKKELKDLVVASGIYEKWTRTKIVCPLEGDYKDFHYTTGNVHLIFEEEGCDRGDDLDLEIKYIDIFQGVWMHIDMAREIESSRVEETVDCLRRFTEGEIHYSSKGTTLDLAIDSAFKIFSCDIGRNYTNVQDMKNGFLINLAYERKILDIISENIG